MSLDIPAIQRALTAGGLDGWLLYDFHGSNPIAVSLTGLTGVHTTRRWYYWIPVSGDPVKLVHRIERDVLTSSPGETRQYAERTALESALRAMLHGARVIAMEFSPNGAIPYLARVDAGTIDFVRSLGPRIVSSGDLIGQFEAAWSADQTAMHHAASEKLYRIKDRAFAFVRERLSARESVSEIALQAEMTRWFGEEGLVTDAPPMVATGVHTGNPHYSPLPDTSASIGVPGLLLLDLWGKLDKPRAVYADITWVGHTGALPPRIGDAFETIVRARDAAVSLVAARVTTGEPIRGWEVDRAARDLIAAAGYGEQFVHRTGHSLGEEVHGNGVHMDDYETHDDRQILAGTGFTIEPGIYTPEFGVRTEINVVVTTRAATVTGPRQQAISRLDG